MSEVKIEGGCQCGAVRYRAIGDPTMVALCHCCTCRRATGAPAVAWALFRKDQVQLLAGEPKTFVAEPGVARGFCEHCGTPLTFEADYLPGLIDLTVGSFDDPRAVRPALHLWHSEHLAWLELADSLPRYDGFPPTE